MPRHILLVGDEAQRLHAPDLLPRVPHLKVRSAQGCAQAIEELERRVPDVMVADMDVLAEEGIPLLLTVAQRWPGISRIALSGLPDYPGQAYQMPAPAAHQYIGWDTAQADLREAIERCLQLQDLLSAPGLRALIGSIRHLPSRPRIFTRLQVMLSHRNVTPKKICAVIEADAAITAKVMQLANCALFHHGERVRNMEQALVRLGFLGVRNLVLCTEVLAGWNRQAGRQFRPGLHAGPRAAGGARGGGADGRNAIPGMRRYSRPFCTTSATGCWPRQRPRSWIRLQRWRSAQTFRCMRPNGAYWEPVMRRSEPTCSVCGACPIPWLRPSPITTRPNAPPSGASIRCRRWRRRWRSQGRMTAMPSRAHHDGMMWSGRISLTSWTAAPAIR